MAILPQDLENKLWSTADQLRANSELTSAEYKTPVLGLVFLRFADERFSAAQNGLAPQSGAAPSRRTIGKQDYQAKGILYLPNKGD